MIPDVVSNEDPRQWQYTGHDVGTSELTWFSAVFFAEPDGDQVYLFGHVGAGQNSTSPTILSRANFADLLQQNWDRREYWAQPGQWSKDPANFQTIGVPSWETTCTWSCELGLWCSFWIPFLDPAVYLYTAETVTGEWAVTKILPTPSAQMPTGSDELSEWAKIKLSDKIDELASYLDRFPSSRYSEYIRHRLSALRSHPEVRNSVTVPIAPRWL